MKHHLVKSIAALFLAVCPMAMSAQQSWAIVSLESNQDTPKVAEYHSLPGKGANGIEYMRIYDDSYRFRNEAYNPESGSYTIHVGDNAYTTGVKGIADNATKAAGMYDLTGRKLEARPSSGIYIQDGKKYVK